jgi:hypothetical protein
VPIVWWREARSELAGAAVGALGTVTAVIGAARHAADRPPTPIGCIVLVESFQLVSREDFTGSFEKSLHLYACSVELWLQETETPMANTYEELKEKVRQFQEAGQLSKSLTPEEKMDWAYGNTVIENASVTREMVRTAYEAKQTK